MDFELIQLLKASTGRQDLSTGEIYSMLVPVIVFLNVVWRNFNSKAYCSIFSTKAFKCGYKWENVRVR